MNLSRPGFRTRAARGSRRPPSLRVAIAPGAAPRPRAVRRPDHAALARVAAINRRRTADVTVHLGAILLILSTVLAPPAVAQDAVPGCGPSCGITAADAWPGPSGAPDASGSGYPPPTDVAAAPAGTAPAVVQAVDPDTAPPTAAAPAVAAPLDGAPAVAAAPAVTAPTVTAPTPGAPTVTTPAMTAAPTTSPPVTGDGVTAAATQNWGQPSRADEFTGPLAGWSVYDGPGHAGNGRRSPSAATVSGGVLTLSGDAAGTTAGMAWGTGATYGRWEGRVRAPAADPSYHAVMLLWPDAENWPVGGEVDVMEMSDPARATTDAFLHYGAANSQLHGAVSVDATQWHNWAVEWTPDHITTFLDGVPWWTTSNRSALPPGPMHLCLQLDWFPTGRAVAPSTMQVDRVRYYPYAG